MCPSPTVMPQRDDDHPRWTISSSSRLADPMQPPPQLTPKWIFRHLSNVILQGPARIVHLHKQSPQRVEHCFSSPHTAHTVPPASLLSPNSHSLTWSSNTWLTEPSHVTINQTALTLSNRAMSRGQKGSSTFLDLLVKHPLRKLCGKPTPSSFSSTNFPKHFHSASPSSAQFLLILVMCEVTVTLLILASQQEPA